MASSQRFSGPLLSSATLETAFGGETVHARMNYVRSSLQYIRRKWHDNEDYNGLLDTLRNYLKLESQPSSIRDLLKLITEGYHDYADTNYARPLRQPPDQYACLQLYCTKDGYDFIFRLVSQTLRSSSVESETVLVAAILLELLTIDLYNLRLSNIGDEMFANFQGVTFRGLTVTAKDINDYRRIASAENLSERNFAIPLGLTSSTTNREIMEDFAKTSKSTQYIMHMTIHVHGLDPDLLSMYLKLYPDSVVTTICAMPVARLSPFGEKEILLRGAFFHIINMHHAKIDGRDVYSLVVVMINANRDHTTESSSDEGLKAKQRLMFSKVVKASRFEVCAMLAENYSQDEANQYRRLQEAELNDLEALHLKTKFNTRLADARSNIKSTWLGGSLFDTYPETYALRRQSFREAILNAQWSKAVQILRHEYEGRLNDWFSIMELKGNSTRDALSGLTILHIIASTSKPFDDSEESGAWEFLENAIASVDVWKTIRTHNSSRLIAQDLATLQGNDRLAKILKPRRYHNLSFRILQTLEFKLHELMSAKAGHLIRSHSFNLPPIEILTEMERPHLWIPIPHMHGGFNIELKGAELEVTVFETIRGRLQPQITVERLSSD